MDKIKIVCMGDSLTEGYGLNTSDRWSNLLSEELKIEIINRGISGDTSGGMLGRFREDVILHAPSHVIIFGGTNDLSFNLPDRQIISNIFAMTRQAKQYGIQSIIGIPTPFFDQGLPPGKSITLLAQQFADRLQAYQHNLKQFAIEDEQPLIEFGLHMTGVHFMADGVHPNEKGHLVMKKNAKAVLEKLLFNG